MTSGRSSNRSGSSRRQRFKRTFRGRWETWRAPRFGKPLSDPVSRVQMPCEDRTCVTDMQCARNPGSDVHVGDCVCRCPDCGCITASGAAVPRPEPEAVTGATHLFRCLLWASAEGWDVHSIPTLRGGSLRASNPMREGHRSAATDAVLKPGGCLLRPTPSGHGFALARSVGPAAVGRAAGYHTEAAGLGQHFARGEEDDQSRTG